MKKFSLLFIFILFCQSLFAKEYALQVFEQADSVLETSTNALSLETVKEMAVGDGVDSKIAYERLFQAQRKISLARAQYFPYGVGDVAAIYFTGTFAPLLLVELVTSLPSKWYNVRNQKHLRNAQSWNLKALKENIKNQTALLYYNINKEEAMVRLASYELKLLEELIMARRYEAMIGVYDQNKVENLELRALNLRDEYLKFSAYLNEEKAAMKMLLNLPYTQKLELQPIPNFLTANDFDVDASMLAEIAQNRSYEIKAAEQVVQAAYDSKRSAQWSILSFSGIGFGYLGNVRFQKSKVREAQFRLDATRNNVHNNVFARVSMFRNSVEYFISEKVISDNSKKYVESKLESFNKGELSVSELIEAELYFLRDYREMLQAHYSSYIRLDDLERVVLGSVNELQYDDAYFSVKAQETEYSTVFELLDTDGLIDEVESVTYTFGDNNTEDIKSFNSRSQFRVRVNNRKLQYPFNISMKIIFKNGEFLNKEIKVKK